MPFLVVYGFILPQNKGKCKSHFLILPTRIVSQIEYNYDNQHTPKIREGGQAPKVLARLDYRRVNPGEAAIRYTTQI